MTETLTIETAAGPAVVELDRGDGLVLLTHGAGGGVHSLDLDAVRDLLVARGIGVGLVTQPYRVAGRRAPPQPHLQDAAWVTLVEQLAHDGPLIVGGRSNGARVACRTAVGTGAAGVLALAFPLHPPGRPEKSRIEELNGAEVPTLVIQGERDPFGRPPSGPDRTIVVVPGDHALKRDTAAVAAAAGDFVTSLLARA